MNVPVGSDTVATATLTLIAGSARRFVVTAVDTAGVQTHRADTTITLQPGANPNLAVRLDPLPSSLGITVTFGGVRLVVADTSTRVMAVGDTLRIVASGFRANGAVIPVDSLGWGSANPATATVAAGLVSAVRLGETFVTAYYGNAAARVRIVVGAGSENVTTYPNADAGVVDGEPDSLRVLNPTPVLFEAFDYTITGPFDYSSAVLESGKVYRLTISGRGGVGPLDGSNYQNSMSDAAFFFCGFFENIDTCQVPASGTNWVSAWSGFAARRPFPDVYTSAHVYDYYVRGKGEALTWTFRDDPYGDNSANFRVEIYSLGSLVP